MDPQRRSFLRGRLAPLPNQPRPPRPPWAVDESAFVARCTRCDACVQACPPAILHRGDGGFPEVRFTEQGCTECGACVHACQPAALQRLPGATPWAWKPHIGEACLARRRVECRVCGETCDHNAIRFRPTLGGVAQPQLDPDRCTGCGACVGPCPTQAIVLQDPTP